MRKSAIYAGTTAFLILASNTGWAGPLTVPNTFVTGTKAVADDVNENFAATKAAVDGNAADISTNTTDITTNAAAIDANAASITANTTAINAKANTADVTSNTTAIGTNAASIALNATAIAAKADATDVSDNAAAIATNASDISTNATAITAKANATDVSDNAAAIATNTSDISTNATAITSLQQNSNPMGSTCTGNDANDIMVRVGPLCVDKYEASVWNSSSTTPFGTSSDNYPGSGNPDIGGFVGCNDNGHGCSGAAAESLGNAIYARSEPGVLPSRFITWFQAAQACANSGKRLLTNAEWQVAAAGTDKANCNVSSGVVSNTDSNSSCVSNWGVTNMVGNVNEWVADWIQGTGSAPTNDMGQKYDNDRMSGVNEPSSAAGWRTLAAVYRGGGAGGGGVFVFNSANAPSLNNGVVGFRCAR